MAKGTSLTLDTWWDVYKFYDTDRPLYMPKYKFFDEKNFFPDHLLFQEKNNVQFAQKESGKIQMTGERYMKNKQEKVL